MAACSLLLVALPFATAPGDIIADTKFELVVNPTGFLARRAHPVGPAAVRRAAEPGGRLPVPDGAVLRARQAAVRRGLDRPAAVDRRAARRGLRRRRCGWPGGWASARRGPRAAAGLAYALSPAALSIIGSMSGEFLPMAMLPWILIPLTDARPWRRGTGAGYPGPSARARAVARSAVAVALCSGMNAASAVAVLVPAFLYILTRPGAWPRTRMLAWWIPAVVLVTCSWSVPLRAAVEVRRLGRALHRVRAGDLVARPACSTSSAAPRTGSASWW